MSLTIVCTVVNIRFTSTSYNKEYWITSNASVIMIQYYHLQRQFCSLVSIYFDTWSTVCCWDFSTSVWVQPEYFFHHRSWLAVAIRRITTSSLVYEISLIKVFPNKNKIAIHNFKAKILIFVIAVRRSPKKTKKTKTRDKTLVLISTFPSEHSGFSK